MSSDHFTVAPAILREHASAVRQIANGVDTAGDAANEVGIGGVSTYGLICSPILLPAMHVFFGDAQTLVKQAAALGDAYAEGLDANCDVYQGVDQDARDVLNKVHSDIA